MRAIRVRSPILLAGIATSAAAFGALPAKSIQFVYSFAPGTELAIQSNNKNNWKLFFEGTFTIDWTPTLENPTSGTLVSSEYIFTYY